MTLKINNGRDGWRFVASLVEPGDFDESTTHEVEVKLKKLPAQKWRDMGSDEKRLQVDVIRESLLDVKIPDENGGFIDPEAAKAFLLGEQWAVRCLFQYQSGLQNGLTSGEVKQVLLGNSRPAATT